MPQMGDLLQGFLYRKQEYEQEEVAEEEKKRQKLEDQLAELNFTELQRTMEKSAFEYEKLKERWGAFEELSLSEQKQVRFGIEGEGEEYPYATGGGVIYHKGTGEYRGLPETKGGGESKFEKAFGDVRSYFERTQPGERGALGPETPPELLDQRALDEAMKLVHPKMFGEEEETEYTGKELLGLGGALEGTDFVGLADSLKTLGGERVHGEVFGEEEEHPEEDAYIQQVKPYLSDYDIDWDVIAEKHPNWNIEYIKTKLGQ